MFARYFILACIVSCVVMESIEEVDKNYSGTLFNELPCTVIGGTCQVKGKCPEGTRVTIEGFCPYQEKHGVQCCHSSKAKYVPKTNTCLSRGGECMEAGIRCPENLTFRAASDCKSDQTCCILVK